jgi:hypothetical protein
MGCSTKPIPCQRPTRQATFEWRTIGIFSSGCRPASGLPYLDLGRRIWIHRDLRSGRSSEAAVAHRQGADVLVASRVVASGSRERSLDVYFGPQRPPAKKRIGSKPRRARTGLT